MHEIGHALGLAHPHVGEHKLPVNQDYSNYTLMSYEAPDNASYYDSNGNFIYLMSSTPMVYDIAALQHLYGTSSHNEQDTTYKFDPSKPFVEAIWDSGGYDTIDLSNFNKACTVNLTPGAYSTIVCTSWSMPDNLGIAFGAVIEEAIGGFGKDIITGNITANVLYGGAGNDFIDGEAGDDSIVGGLGDDKLFGGTGSDIFKYSKGDGNDTILDFNSAIDRIEYSGFSDLEISNFIENVMETGHRKISFGDGHYLTVEKITAFTVTSTALTRSGSKLADTDVVMSDGTNNLTFTSSSDGKASGSLTAGSPSSATVSLTYSTSTKAISSQDALDALKLSVGLSTSAGTKTAFDFISADFNQDGKVSSQDALSILKYSVGLTTSEQAKWVFVDTNGDYSGVSKSNTSYTEGVSIADLTADTSVSLTGILIGDVNDSYSGLIA
jgi:hypothetical protein